MSATGFWIRFVLAVLATWRVTHLLANEDGPANLIVRFRARLGRGWTGSLMDCFNCLSFWIAAPAALFVSQGLLDWLFTGLALSGAACLLERLGHDPVIIHPDSAMEGDAGDGMLRSEESDAQESLSGSRHPGADQRSAATRA